MGMKRRLSRKTTVPAEDDSSSPACVAKSAELTIAVQPVWGSLPSVDQAACITSLQTLAPSPKQHRQAEAAVQPPVTFALVPASGAAVPSPKPRDFPVEFACAGSTVHAVASHLGPASSSTIACGDSQQRHQSTDFPLEFSFTQSTASEQRPVDNCAVALPASVPTESSRQPAAIFPIEFALVPSHGSTGAVCAGDVARNRSNAISFSSASMSPSSQGQVPVPATFSSAMVVPSTASTTCCTFSQAEQLQYPSFSRSFSRESVAPAQKTITSAPSYPNLHTSSAKEAVHAKGAKHVDVRWPGQPSTPPMRQQEQRMAIERLLEISPPKSAIETLLHPKPMIVETSLPPVPDIADSKDFFLKGINPRFPTKSTSSCQKKQAIKKSGVMTSSKLKAGKITKKS